MKRILSLLLLLALVVTMLPTGAAAAQARVPIYVGNLAADYLAEEILKSLDLEHKSDEEQILAVYDWIIANGERYEWDGQYRFDAAEVQLASQGSFAREYNEKLENGQILLRQQWEDASGLCGTDYFDFSLDTNYHVGAYAYEMAMKMTGNCAHFTSLLTVLLGHLGYDSRVFHGDFINMDGSAVEHTWNYVLIDGTWYWMDVRIDHSIGGGSHQYYMIEDTEAWALEHTWPREHSDWLADHTDEIFSLYTEAAEAVNQVELTCSDWSKDYMYRALELDLIPDALLHEDLAAPITREEFSSVALLLYQSFTGAAAVDYEGDSPFTDCSASDVLKTYSLGIVNGMGNGTFAPEATLTREQASTMLGRVYELSSQGVIFGGQFLPQGLSQFTDHGQIFDYAKHYIYFFSGAGIIDGMGDGTFAPKGTMTREQALKIAVTCLENL